MPDKSQHPLNTMDNAAFERDAAARGFSMTTTTVEMGEFCVPLDGAGPGRAPPPRTSSPLCRPDVCRGMMAPQATLAAQSLVRKSAAMRPNPWHRYKTVLLVATVVGLVVWAVAYVVLEQLDVL